MREVNIGRLLELHELLVIERGHFERARHKLERQHDNLPYLLALQDFHKLKNAVVEIEQIATDARLESTRVAANRTAQMLSNIGYPPNLAEGISYNSVGCRGMFNHLLDILSRLRDDCSSHLYFQISPGAAPMVQPNSAPFGQEVEKKFVGAIEDIDEAARCLALERATACIFHVMRVLEIAVCVVANKIGANTIDEHGRGLPWGVIANNMKSVIDKMPKGSDQQTSWYRVQSYLEVVNRAWRTPTAHPKQTYTIVEAQKVFEATRTFMQELAPLA